jgi:hypothetical protein
MSPRQRFRSCVAGEECQVSGSCVEIGIEYDLLDSIEVEDLSPCFFNK